ncbi:hypothetical protein V490_07086 [Pseudogymnoascus sp. VKM F-3557]|nr:hypothetical protein V490_07086 [Pseudogymnoascus sp. VKM F-3557]
MPRLDATWRKGQGVGMEGFEEGALWPGPRETRSTFLIIWIRNRERLLFALSATGLDISRLGTTYYFRRLSTSSHQEKVLGNMPPDTKKMNETPATNGPPSPTRRLNRSKSVFSLAQDFFKMALDTPSDEPTSVTRGNLTKPGPWSLFGSLRGTWSGNSPSANSLRPRGPRASQSLKPLDTSHGEDASSSLLRHRKSLHNLFGTVGRRSSINGARTEQTMRPNVLRKRSGSGNMIQAPGNPSIHSIEDADRTRPPQTYTAGSHATIGRKKVTFEDEAVDSIPRRDSGIGLDAIHAPMHEYQSCTLGERALDDQQTGVISLQPKNPIEQVRLSETPSPGTDSRGDTLPLPSTFSNGLPATQPIVCPGEACLKSRYPETVSHSLKRTKEYLDFGSLDYDKILAAPDMPIKIDIDPLFTSRALSLEHKYKNLSIWPKLRQSANTEQNPRSILESIDQNATTMSNNLNIPEDRCSHGRLSSHSNDTAPPDTSPRKSWANAGLLGHECGMFAQSDKIDGTKALFDEKYTLGYFPNNFGTTPPRENIVCDERHSLSPGNSLHETLSASPVLVPKGEKSLPPKKRRAMKSMARNSSIGPFHINFPITELSETHHETYQTKSEAIGSLFQSVGEYSDYILFNRVSNTFYPQPKGYIFSPLEQTINPTLECVWLPMQFDQFGDMGPSQEQSISLWAANRRGGDHQLIGIGECERDTPVTLTSQSEESQSLTSTLSNNSLLDLYFGTMETEQQRLDSKLKQSDVTPATAFPIPLVTPVGDPASLQKLDHISDDIGDEVITSPLDAGRSVEKTKTWADLGVEFIDKYAPNKDADDQKRAADAARNFLRIHGNFTSDYDPVTKPQRKTWSRDTDGSEDISFLHIEDLARYETLRAEYRRHVALDFGSSIGSSSSTDALAEINYIPRTREVSRVSSQDSGYVEGETMLTGPHLGSRERSMTSESVAGGSRCSSSEAIEDIATPEAMNKRAVSPCHPTAPSMEEEHAQPPVMESTETVGGDALPRIVRTCSFGEFEFEILFDPEVETRNILNKVDRESGMAARRAPLQGERSNFIRQGRLIQNRPASQVKASYGGQTDEPPQKHGRVEEDEKENEDRQWRDIMLYG